MSYFPSLFLVFLVACVQPSDTTKNEGSSTSEDKKANLCQNSDESPRACTSDEIWLQKKLNNIFGRLFPALLPEEKIRDRFPEILVSNHEATFQDLVNAQLLMFGEQHNKPDWTVNNLILASLALKAGQNIHVLFEEPYASDLLPVFDCADAFVWQIIMELRKQDHLSKYTKTQAESLFFAIQPGLSSNRNKLKSFNLKCGTWDDSTLVFERGRQYAKTVEGQLKRNQTMIGKYSSILEQDADAKIISFGGAAHFPFSQMMFNVYRLLRFANQTAVYPGLRSYLDQKLGNNFSVDGYYSFAKDWYQRREYAEHAVLKKVFVDLNTSEIVANGIKNYRTLTLTGAKIGLED